MLNDVNRRLKALLEFGQVVTSGVRLHEEEVLELIYSQASKLIDTDNMYIALYDEATDTVRFRLAFVDGRRIDVEKEPGWQPRQAGKGRTEEIIHTKKPMFHATRAEAEEWYAQPGHLEYFGQVFASWLGVPMMVGEKVLGVIVTYHPTQDNAYGSDDLETLQAMANQAAIALDNAHMFHDVNYRLEVLVEFGQVVTSGVRLHEEEVLELIYSHASELMDTDNMYIALYDEATDTVRFRLAFVEGQRIDVATDERWQPRKAGKGRTEEIIRTKKPIFIATKAEAEVWYDKPGRKDYLTREMLPSWLGVPMMVGEKVLGVIATYHPTRDYVYSGDDLEILQAMASQAAIALNEARVYTAWQQEQERRIEAERLGYLGSVAAVLAHRIGNKGGMIRRCVKDLYPLVDQKNKEIMDNLQTLERNNQFLLTMSEELLKPSTAASATLEPLDINMLLEEALDHADIPPEINVSTKLTDELPLVRANRWLVDVFLELISNAVKAMTDSPVKCLEIGSRPGKEFLVEVWCADTGCGIAEEKRGAIFDMFHTDAEEEGHLGFGLWWIKTFITGIDGEVDFESEFDKGTTFVVKLGRRP